MGFLSVCVWMLQCVFSCNHLRTPVNEGKCYCPDCGEGLIYRWVVLRCSECRFRRESRYFLRQAVPAENCCPHCGGLEFSWECLESPAYYQLYKARLIVETAQDYEHSRRLAWTVCSMAQVAEAAIEKTRASSLKLLHGVRPDVKQTTLSAVTIR